MARRGKLKVPVSQVERVNGERFRHARNAGYAEDVARNPDPALHEGLIRKHSGRLAVRFRVPIEEARHEIMIQWWRWAQRYDPKRVRWSTYFHSHVLRQAMEQMLRAAGWGRCSVPGNGKKGFHSSLKRPPPVLMGRVVSRHAERGSGEWAEPLGGFRLTREARGGGGGGGDGRPDVGDLVADRVGREEARERVAVMLEALGEVERSIVELRLRGLTLEEIGEHVGLTRERVRQVQDGAMRKMARWEEAPQDETARREVVKTWGRKYGSGKRRRVV